MLIHAYARTRVGKRNVARALLRDLWLARTGVVSRQVLHEFYVNDTRKIAQDNK